MSSNKKKIKFPEISIYGNQTNTQPNTQPNTINLDEAMVIILIFIKK